MPTHQLADVAVGRLDGEVTGVPAANFNSEFGNFYCHLRRKKGGEEVERARARVNMSKIKKVK